MEGTERQIESILLKDDVKAFDAVASECLSARFGRFPTHTLLYIFGAKKILRKYGAELLSDRARTQYPSIPEAERRFAAAAGKSLRHFASGEVSPLEWLAITGRTKALKKLYKIYPFAEKHLPLLHKIYVTRLGTGVAAKGREILLPKEPMSYFARRMARIACVVCAAMCAVTLFFTLFIALYVGFGSEAAPYAVRSDGGLKYAIGQGGYATLAKDVHLSEAADTVDAHIDGKGNKIYLTTPFAAEFTGTLKDVTFVLEEGYKGAAVIGTNKGTIENVSVVTADLKMKKSDYVSDETETEEETEPKTTYLSLFTVRNEGKIQASYAVHEITFEGTGGGNCYFAPFAGENAGILHDCDAQGTFTSNAVDVAGIACKNEEAGTITDCTSAVALSQTTTIEAWNPNVSGIVGENEGAVYGCVNTGNITAEIRLESAEQPTGASSYAAGICATNRGSVRACRNAGAVTSIVSRPAALESDPIACAAGITCTNVGEITETTNAGVVRADGHFAAALAAGIAVANTYTQWQSSSITSCSGLASVTAESDSDSAFAGGIAARNYPNCTISACRQTADVRASAPPKESEEQDLYAFAGGVVGFNAGSLSGSFYTGTLAEGGASSYMGGVCGLAYASGSLNYMFQINLSVSVRDCAYLAGEGESYALGSIYLNSQWDFGTITRGSITGAYQLAGSDDIRVLRLGATAAATMEELSALEIYFE